MSLSCLQLKLHYRWSIHTSTSLLSGSFWLSSFPLHKPGGRRKVAPPTEDHCIRNLWLEIASWSFFQCWKKHEKCLNKMLNVFKRYSEVLPYQNGFKRRIIYVKIKFGNNPDGNNPDGNNPSYWQHHLHWRWYVSQKKKKKRAKMQTACMITGVTLLWVFFMRKTIE